MTAWARAGGCGRGGAKWAWSLFLYFAMQPTIRFSFDSLHWSSTGCFVQDMGSKLRQYREVLHVPVAQAARLFPGDRHNPASQAFPVVPGTLVFRRLLVLPDFRLVQEDLVDRPFQAIRSFECRLFQEVPVLRCCLGYQVLRSLLDNPVRRVDRPFRALLGNRDARQVPDDLAVPTVRGVQGIRAGSGCSRAKVLGIGLGGSYACCLLQVVHDCPVSLEIRAVLAVRTVPEGISALSARIGTKMEGHGTIAFWI